MIDLKWKKYWFTLAEVIVVCSMFAVMVIWIIVAINRAFVFMDNTRLALRASNLARWWVEMVYNLRDSNWRKYSWERDKNRLNIWTWWSAIWEWIYTINESKNSNWDSYVYLSWLTVSSISGFYDSIEWFFSDDYSGVIEGAKLDFTWIYSYYSWNATSSIISTWNLGDLLDVNWLEFYRVLRVYGIYCKTGESPNQLVNSSHCKQDSDPKEMRFCVKVFYRNIQWKHSSELCSLMTNFME